VPNVDRSLDDLSGGFPGAQFRPVMKVPVDEAVETYTGSSRVCFGSVKSKGCRCEQESDVEQAAAWIKCADSHVARTKNLPAWQTPMPASVFNQSGEKMMKSAAVYHEQIKPAWTL
jgi:hypothetical protein